MISKKRMYGMYSTFCNFLTVPVIVIFKVLHYSHLGGVLPESGVPEGDILISLHCSALVRHKDKLYFLEAKTCETEVY